MGKKRFVSLMLAACCLFALSSSAGAASVDCDATYCFTPEDFSQLDEPLTGICITGLPDGKSGAVMLGSRVLQPGDILTAKQLEQMTFSPVRREQDASVQVSYLPIYENRVEKNTVMTLSVKGKEDKAPAAEDSAIETYKNLPNEGKLKASDPEGEKLVYTLVRSPKRGEVVIHEDGTFSYTPKKNKVGVDSFTFTAADPAGNVSRTATVTIQILKPTDSTRYTDTVGKACQFEAEWMRNTGLFEGEKISGQECFQPERSVTKGQFLAMAVKLLDIPLEEDAEVSAEVPQWLKPYMAAAMRSGLLEGLPSTQSGMFEENQPVTGAEVAVMLQNALDLTITRDVMETAAENTEEIPVWAKSALTVLGEYGVCLQADAPITRGQAAEVLYRVSDLMLDAPGTAVFRMQK